jgi:hypothetical protein
VSLEPFGSQPAVVTIGDIVVTPEHVITPQGRFPVGQVHWSLSNQSYTSSTIPPYAIVLAIVFALFCLLGLLFLLIKEERTVGFAQVAVQGPGLFHAVQLPVSVPHDLVRYQDMVNDARSVSASRWGR